MTPKARKIPKFASEAQEREFWDSHDTAEYLDELEPDLQTKFVRPRKEVVSLRLEHQVLQTIKSLASQAGIGYSPLIRRWLLDRVRLETARRRPHVSGSRPLVRKAA